MAFRLAVYASQCRSPRPTQDSLPAAGQALPDGLSTRKVPTKGFRVASLHLILPSQALLGAKNFTVEMHISELNQLFNSLDPSPFYAKELDRNAEEYIVRAAQELPSNPPTALVVHLATVSAPPSDENMLNQALTAHFARQLQRFRRKLRQLINRGWISLGIGLAFLGTCLIGGEIVSQAIGRNHIARVLQESLVIGGWVAMWRPLEIFLYDWWPILGRCRIYDRLSRIPVRIVYDGKSSFQQPAPSQ